MPDWIYKKARIAAPISVVSTGLGVYGTKYTPLKPPHTTILDFSLSY